MQRFLFIALALIIIVFGGGALYLKLSQSNIKAVMTAEALCNPDTKQAEIHVSFANNDTKSFTVTAKDNQTNNSVQLSTVAPKEKKSDVITTSKTSLKNGTVTFSLSTQNGLIPAQKTVNYTAVDSCEGFAGMQGTTNTNSGTTVHSGKNLPATGVPAWTWILLLGALPAGFLFKKFAR